MDSEGFRAACFRWASLLRLMGNRTGDFSLFESGAGDVVRVFWIVFFIRCLAHRLFYWST
jgi:hypothetical protein